MVNPEYNPNRPKSTTPLSPHPYLGFVKRNDDPQHMGRVSVWIPEIGGDPTQESSWVICSYLSHYGGHTNIKKIPNYQTNPEVAQQSYGFVGVPPDLEVQVLVIFANGDMSKAYWIGCAFQQSMSQMIPAIGGAKTTDGKSEPTLEYNKGATTGSVANPSRPRFAPLADGLNTQGTHGDDERGSSTTSMQRESPPKMLGYLSPRGNSIHIDDAEDNEFIRMRTRSGTQVLINETTGMVYINSKTGNSWIEISDSGISAYSAGSISLRAGKDFNVHADGNINMDAAGSVNMRASGTFNRQGANINDYATGGMEIHHGAGLAGSSVPNATQSGGGWSGGGKVNSIASTVPSHEPSQGHPKRTVPDKPKVAAKPAYGKAHGAKKGDTTSASQIDKQQGNFGA